MLKNHKLLDALIERNALKIKLAEIEKAIKETAEYLYQEAGEDSVLQVSGNKIECRCIRRIAPKYKELAFELVGEHPERLQELADSDRKRFINETISYQIHILNQE
ncbi:MAG: hypothetical protein CVT49_12345 [candidate division Zixibacteria bacterium HGW-Zixibacteria-1]|nr:MAG: hypothetical protein CVT49_12345 [candidate division Zixibacteria bacterium HGW-Zixibacteria-1]